MKTHIEACARLENSKGEIIGEATEAGRIADLETVIIAAVRNLVGQSSDEWATLDIRVLGLAWDDRDVKFPR